MVATTSLNMITVCAIGLVTLILTAPVKTKKDAYQIEFQVWWIELELNEKVLLQMKAILDNCNTDYVSQFKFSEFVKGFGPLKLCIQNMNDLLIQPWFHGFLSSSEAEYLLRDELDGTFLIRFNGFKTGSFISSFKKNQKTYHMPIETCVISKGIHKIYGFKILEKSKLFINLVELVNGTSNLFQIP